MSFKFAPLNIQRMRDQLLSDAKPVIKNNSYKDNEFKNMINMRITDDPGVDDTRMAILLNTSFETKIFDIYNPSFSSDDSE